MPWAHCTNAGRVVYDRRPTPFKCSDLRRIARKLAARALAAPSGEREAELQCILDVLVELELAIAFELEMIGSTPAFVTVRLRQALEVINNDFEGFSGGLFGGGGASRDF